MAWTQDRVAKLYRRVAVAMEQARQVSEHATALGAVGQPGDEHTAEGEDATERARGVPAVHPRRAKRRGR